MEVKNKISFDWKRLSWEKSEKLLHLFQLRLVKALFTNDFITAFKLQKLILQSNSSRLLCIRYVTQLCPLKKIPGVDLKIALTFLERFELNEFLKTNFASWKAQGLKCVFITEKDGNLLTLQIPTIADRVWQHLLMLALKPAHTALFHPRHFISDSLDSTYKLQRCVSLNIGSSSLGFQKRILKLEVPKLFCSYNKNYLIGQIMAPRSIKLSICQLFSKNFCLQYLEGENSSYGFPSLLYDILLDNVKTFGRYLQFKSTLLFFLKPLEIEKPLFNELVQFFEFIGLKKENLYFNLTSSLIGFDFLGWHFRTLQNGELFVLPSNVNYQTFLLRVKHIVNYGL